MLSALPTKKAPGPDDGANGMADTASGDDSRSSSLSDLEDGTEDQDDTPTRVKRTNAADENDSEAETERLESTPQKLIATAGSMTYSPSKLGKSPSKLAQEVTSYDTSTADVSPTASKGSTLADDVLQDGIGPTAALDILANSVSEADKLPEAVGRKRKRTSSQSSSADEATALESPPKKRAGSVRSTVNGDRDAHEVVAEVEAVGEDVKNALLEVSLNQEQEELENGEAEAEAVAEEVTEQVVARAKASRHKKGKRKGKKTKDVETIERDNVAAESVPPEGDEEAEGEVEEEDAVAAAEEAARKKEALEAMSSIEKQFTTFREKMYDERIAQLSRELDLLQQPDCQHPEYLAQVRCVDERRDEKIRIENIGLRYKQKALDVRFVAERAQLQSQYFQTVRDVREEALERINNHLFKMQKERRNIGADEREYFYRFPRKRSDQIKQQTAYNMEVSVLSGVAKYVGFPAAPELHGVPDEEATEDLKGMKIPPRVPVPSFTPHARVSVEHTHEAASWINAQPSAHQHAHYQSTSQPSRIPSNPFNTPAAQRRPLEPYTTNGSASTIEMPSNPPSSALAQTQTPQEHHTLARDTIDSPLHRRISGAAVANSGMPFASSPNISTPSSATIGGLRITNALPAGREAALPPQAFPISSLHGSHQHHAAEPQQQSHHRPALAPPKLSSADIFGSQPPPTPRDEPPPVRDSAEQQSGGGPPSTLGFAPRVAAGGGGDLGRSGGRFQ